MNFLKRFLRGKKSNRPHVKEVKDGEMRLEPQFLKQVVKGIATTRSEEWNCDECFDQLDCFAEMVLAGKPAAEAMPLVQDHLNRCGPCKEEFEALLDALQQLDSE
jgi:hypothetical protein